MLICFVLKFGNGPLVSQIILENKNLINEKKVLLIWSDTKKYNLKALTVKDIKPEVWSKIYTTLILSFKNYLHILVTTLLLAWFWQYYFIVVSLSFSKNCKSTKHVCEFIKKPCYWEGTISQINQITKLALPKNYQAKTILHFIMK